jgi:hypothetical protein
MLKNICTSYQIQYFFYLIFSIQSVEVEVVWKDIKKKKLHVNSDGMTATFDAL